MATFQKLNLLRPFMGLGKFDIIFCRNVAIYFTLEDRKKLFDKIADTLEPDGFPDHRIHGIDYRRLSALYPKTPFEIHFLPITVEPGSARQRSGEGNSNAGIEYFSGR